MIPDVVKVKCPHCGYTFFTNVPRQECPCCGTSETVGKIKIKVSVGRNSKFDLSKEVTIAEHAVYEEHREHWERK